MKFKLEEMDKDMMISFDSRFQNKNIVITGHTGFKGSWLAAWLKLCGAHVTGIALDPPSVPAHFTCLSDAHIFGNDMADHRVDIRDAAAVATIIKQSQPDFVFHMAAQPIVSASYDDPAATYTTNVIGTLHVLEALRQLDKPCAAVMITSDKAYRNHEWEWGYREHDELGGADPYSASKAAAELVIQSQIESFFPADGPVRIAVSRAGNVIGGGDWAASRIVPDCARSWAAGEAVVIRSPNATRPWQHVLEPLGGYMALATALAHSNAQHGEAFNFGPPQVSDYPVRDVADALGTHLPGFVWEDHSAGHAGVHEAGLLKLNCDKALARLGWHAALSFEETMQFTGEWYRAYYGDPSSIADVTMAQIEAYAALLGARLPARFGAEVGQ
jgi:CDP-glucose 4,6-dehydratase